jgi:hypothetical protein
VVGKADVVSLVHTVEVARRPASRLELVIGARRFAQLTQAAERGRTVLAGRTIWNVNSTAAGGGVAEMLQVLVGYVQDLGIAIGWLVFSGDAEFFAITKRLHNQIHGSLSGAPLGAAEAGHYGRMLAVASALVLAKAVGSSCCTGQARSSWPPPWCGSCSATPSTAGSTPPAGRWSSARIRCRPSPFRSAFP